MVLAKVGLDGHDRGVKVLTRHLREAGIEVIYTGLWQTPAAAAKAAMEEDVDVLGLSLHSAAHNTLVPMVQQEMAARDRPHVPLVLGGIIPPEDVEGLLNSGVAGMFGPESQLDEVTEAIHALSVKDGGRPARLPDTGSIEDWIGETREGSRSALARVLSWIESDAEAGEVERHLGTGPTKAPCIGVTGAPGVGKSTLISQILREIRRRGMNIGVVAVDPASPITRGALLGDRARMTGIADDPGVFVRSSASRGAMGGLSPSTSAMLRAMDLAAMDVLFVETVGAGQSDVEVRKVAATVALVMMPGAGDELQLQKAGITEIAHLFVANKADLPGVDRLVSQIKEEFRGTRPVVKTVASTGEGVPELVDLLLRTGPRS
jgi:LAO/AO transport system ATPase